MSFELAIKLLWGGFVLGRTVPSFRMKLEGEIAEWKPFMKALPSEREKEAFEELMNHCRRHTMAAGASVRPIISDLQTARARRLTEDLHDDSFSI